MNPWKEKREIGNATPWVRIYAFFDPETEAVRYVGKTTRYLGQRIADHVRSAKRGKRLPISMWLRGQLMRGNGICTKLLENVPSGVDWQERERFWIKHFRSSGANLLNLTDGGEGLHGHKFSQTHKDRIAVALRTGSNFKCEQCGNNFWRKPCAIAKGDCRFCSKPCYFEWQRGKPKRMPKHD